MGGDEDGEASLTEADGKVMTRRVWSSPVGGSPSMPIAMYDNMGSVRNRDALVTCIGIVAACLPVPVGGGGWAKGGWTGVMCHHGVTQQIKPAPDETQFQEVVARGGG